MSATYRQGTALITGASISGTSSPAGAVVAVDDLAAAPHISTFAVAAAEPIMKTSKVVLLTNGMKDVDSASFGFKGASAWLSIHCPEGELLEAVQGLLQDAPLTWRPPPIGTDVSPHHTPNSETVAPRAHPTGGLAPGALRRVREHIEAHFAQKIELSRLAGIAGLSTSYFSRAFKQTIGMPPHRYVMIRRLAAAAELVKKTDRPLTELAIEVGFSDQSHFTRAFTQMTGETPGALRRRYR